METSSSNGSMRSEKKKNKKKLGLWKPEEDTILKRYVEAHGEGNWPTVSLRSGLLRGGKSCRLRWKNYLRPNIKRGTISKEEEDLIIRMHKLLGNRWSLIAGRLPGRTDNEVKNYWNTRLNKSSRCLSKRTIFLKPKNQVNVNSDKNIIQVPPEQSTDVPPERPDPTHHPLEIIKQDTSHWIEDGDRMMINGYDALEPYTTILAPGYKYNHSMSLVFDDDELILPSLDSLVWIESFGLDGE